MDETYVDPKRTRMLQGSDHARRANLDRIEFWGAYNLIKVVDMARPVVRNSDGAVSLDGYATSLSELSRKTPREIEIVLGLKFNSLAQGCRIYRFLRTPTIDEFEVRGYSSLPDGLLLHPHHKTDAHGYPRGQMAWQIILTTPIPATLVTTLLPGQTFKPGPHPGIRYR